MHPRNMSDMELLNVPTDNELVKELQERLEEALNTFSNLSGFTTSTWDKLLCEDLSKNIEALLNTDDAEETIKLAATIKELNDERMDILEDYLMRVQDLVA